MQECMGRKQIKYYYETENQTVNSECQMHGSIDSKATMLFSQGSDQTQNTKQTMIQSKTQTFIGQDSDLLDVEPAQGLMLSQNETVFTGSDIKVVDAITEQLEQIEKRFQDAEKSLSLYGTVDPNVMDQVLHMKAAVNEMNVVINKIVLTDDITSGSLSESVSDSELDTNSFAA